MQRTFLFFALIIVFFSNMLKAQNYKFENTPEWVKEIEIPKESEVSKYDINAGYYLTLADYQLNSNEKAAYSHEVIKVLSYSGITNASQISVNYDTIYQELKIHHLYIWRNGKKTDRTKELSFEIMNNEQNLQQGIYTGQIIAYDILNDIRKDDLIDFAYTIKGENPIFYNEKYIFFPLEMLNPVDFFSLRILLDKNKEYLYDCVGCEDKIYTKTVYDDYQLIEITQKNVKAFNIEEFIPSWIIPYNYFILSSFKSWSDVNKWAQKVFNIEKEPNLDHVFEEIFTGDETTDQKINKIINFVQDDIRYMGIESGIGSIKPFPPEKVAAQRFGDCKDKSLLLVTLLKKIGIQESYPALVNVSMKNEIENLFPGNGVFNHCIVTFNHNDKAYWVDPSLAMQGGDFRDLYTADYGKALIIGKASDSLQNMTPNKIISETIVTDEYIIESFTKPAKLTATSERFGNDADERRVLLEYYTVKDFTDLLLSNLKFIFPVVNTTQQTSISDDTENNRFLITYHMEVDDFWTDGDAGGIEAAKGFWTFKFEPVMLYQYFNVSSCEERDYDFELVYPMNLKYNVIFRFPKEMMFLDDTKIYENEAFYFEERFEQINSKSLHVQYTFKTNSNHIKAEKYEDICNQKNKIAEKLPFIIYFNK